MCVNIKKAINFPFGANENLMVLGVLILKSFKANMDANFDLLC